MKTGFKHVFGDSDMQTFIGRQLRFGVMLAVAIAVVGGIYYLVCHGGEPVPDYAHFVAEPAAYTTLTGIVGGVLQLQAREIIQLAVVVLISTPILRVFFSIFAFAFEKDRLYVVISSIVMLIIIANIWWG